MKLSLNWIKEYVELPSSITPEDISYNLTMSTVEVESVTDLSETLNKIVVGEIKELKIHPDADRLQIAVTDIGGEIKDIVCGGSNLAVGMKVAVSLPGAKVRWHGEGDLVEVKVTKVRGVESYGMICASTEIGLSTLFPLSSEKEILDLKDIKCSVGQSISEVINYNDFIFEIDNKSLTNRPDLWGHYGIARELAAIFSCPLKAPVLMGFEFEENSENLKVEIKNTEKCLRYSGLVFENVTNGEAPFWMKTRLSRVGQKPINLLVDITNYILNGVGQPTHVFSYNDISDASIIVRNAASGEMLKVLDGTEVELSEDDLVIADSKKPESLAGVMGGFNSGVNEDTKKIIFESANFAPKFVRKLSGKFGIRTDSSTRYEKGLDPYQTEFAARMFAHMMSELIPDSKMSGAVDIFPNKPEKKVIEVPHVFIESRIGQYISPEDIQSKLTSLGFKVNFVEGLYVVEVPSWRATGDISIKEDIVEEVARLIGYDNLDYSPIPVTISKSVNQSSYDLEKSIRTFLTSYGNLQEIMTYPWVSDKFIKAIKQNKENAYTLSDPPDPKNSSLKTSLIPNMLEAASKNLRYFDSFGIFEISRVFLNTKKDESSRNDEKLPFQPKSLICALVGANAKDLYLELKGIVTNLFSSLSFDFSFSTENVSWIANEGAINLLVNNVSVGTIGIPSKQTLKKAGIDKASVCLFELNLSKILPLKQGVTKYKATPKFPEVNYDLALLFDTQTPWEEIKKLVLKTDDLIKTVEFQDEYKGQQIPNNKKSIAFRMTMGSSKETLTSEQVDVAAGKVLKAVEDKLGGVLRQS